MRMTIARPASCWPRRAWLTNCAPMTDPVLELTEDAFLGGQLRLKQLKSGHRAGHDAVLLAAATSARSGDRDACAGAEISDAITRAGGGRRRQQHRIVTGAWPASIWSWSRSMRRW